MKADRRSVVVGAVVLAVLLALVVVVSGIGGRGDDAPAPADDDDEAVEQDPEVSAADAQAAEEAANVTSAARGAEGTRTVPSIPDEFPDAILTGDATAIEGTVARGGDDWSALVTYTSDLERDAVEAVVDAAVSAAGFTRLRATFDDERKVIVYDGDDGSTLTVTLNDDGSEVTVGAVLVSP